MKKLAAIFALCLLTTASFAAALVQSNLGGSASATITSGGTLTTTAVGYASNTHTGSLLVVIVWSRSNGLGEIEGTQVPTISTPGFSWSAGSLTYSAFLDLATDTKYGIQTIFYITDAAAMSTSTLTTVSAAVPGTDSCTCTLQFAMYEFSGVSAYIAHNISQNETGTASSPGGVGTSCSPACLMLVNFVGYPVSALTAGSGWTLGVNATVPTIGQTVYNLSATTASSGFFSGTSALWADTAIWFSLSTSASAVPRHRGSIF